MPAGHSGYPDRRMTVLQGFAFVSFASLSREKPHRYSQLDGTIDRKGGDNMELDIKICFFMR